MKNDSGQIYGDWVGLLIVVVVILILLAVVGVI